MGTEYQVRVATHWRSPAHKNLPEAVEKRLAELNLRFSTYLPESELSRFNQYDGGDWFEVSRETAEVVAYALKIAADTDGAFDPTIGPAVNLWGFGPHVPRFDAPTEEQIEVVRQRIGFHQLTVRQQPPALQKSTPDVYVDLSAIAKGYAADAIGALLKQVGYDSYMVEIGGEVVTRGTKPGGHPWRIGIEKPVAEEHAPEFVVELAGDAIATSGDYRNFFEHDGIRYSHTIDPTTARPVTHDLASVTVRRSTCMDADALTTALLVMGPDAGYDWAEQHGVAALLVTRAGNAPQYRATSLWSNSSVLVDE